MSSPARVILLLVFISTFFIIASRSGISTSLTKEQIFQVATLAARDGEYEKAAEFFKKVLEIDPHFSMAYNSLGMVYQAMGGENGSADALRYYQLAVQVDPSNVEALNNLGKAWYSSGQFVQAEQALVKSLELRPGQADINLVTGWVYLLGMSQAELAIKYFKQGIALANDDMAHYGIGLAHLLLDEKFKVFDEITELRRRHKEDLAARLEGMVHGNVKISSTPGTPLVTGVDPGVSLFDKELQSLTAKGFNAKGDSKGIQVRLKGPLAD